MNTDAKRPAHGDQTGLRLDIPDDDDTLELYTGRLMALCAEVTGPSRLPQPDCSVSKRSRLCGSTVTIDFRFDTAGSVAAIGYDVKACSLGTAAAAIMARHAVGSTADELKSVRGAVRALLDGAASVDAPAGWDDIGMLAPARDVRSRHSAIMIVFDAAAEAAERRQAGQDGNRMQNNK